MNNQLIDLNNMLFEQMERLNDDENSQEQFEKEIRKSKAMTDIADKILQVQELAFNIVKKTDEMGIYNSTEQQKLLGITEA